MCVKLRKNNVFFVKFSIFGRNIVQMIEIATVKKVAANVGFDLCGVAECRRFDGDEAFFREWISRGYASSLDYLRRNLDKRFDASQLVEGARTVAVCAVSYKNFVSDGYPSDSRTKVASYACCNDYHTTIKGMLRRMSASLREIYPSLSGRMFVDSAPILEKRYAVEAGLGWIGRQSLLITPQFGSFVLLGELVLCDECDSYDEPLRTAGCGECRRCIEACPNGAIADRHIDTSKCISCATVERFDGTADLHGWIFGCDECQTCCPYNKIAPMHANAEFDPVFDPLAMSADDWSSMTAAEFAERFSATPMSRSGIERIRSNVVK